MTSKIQLDYIESNDELQARYYKLNGSVVYEYEEAMKDGAKFPPVIIFRDSEARLWLADGFHRVAAARQMGATEIAADVRDGTKRDAILYANGPANREHGLQLTRDDKRNRVERMLKDDEWSQWSNRDIAKHCGVSHTFVGMMRERLAPSGNVATPERHWGLANGMAFWNHVKKLELDNQTVLEQLQPGAKVLSDLNMTKEECWSKLAELGMQRLAEAFPVDCTVVHLPTKRVARVLDYSASSMGLAFRVRDLKQQTDELWLAEGIARATQHEIETYLKPDVVEAERPLSVDDVVITRTGHVGFVKSINGAFHHVETVNGSKVHYRKDLKVIDLADGTFQKGFTPEQLNDFRILTAKELAEWNEQAGNVASERDDAVHKLLEKLYATDDGCCVAPVLGFTREVYDRAEAAGYIMSHNSKGNLEDRTSYETFYALAPLGYQKLGLPANRSATIGNGNVATETENPFQVGDRVQWKDDGRGNGVIRYIKGEKCGVYFDHSHTTHYYHWTKLEYEPKAEQPTENDSEIAPHQDETNTANIEESEESLYTILHNFGFKEIAHLPNALQRIMLYLNGLYPHSDEILHHVEMWREFLDRVEATCNAEHEQVAS